MYCSCKDFLLFCLLKQIIGRWRLSNGRYQLSANTDYRLIIGAPPEYTVLAFDLLGNQVESNVRVCAALLKTKHLEVRGARAPVSHSWQRQWLLARCVMLCQKYVSVLSFLQAAGVSKCDRVPPLMLICIRQVAQKKIAQILPCYYS